MLFPTALWLNLYNNLFSQISIMIMTIEYMFTRSGEVLILFINIYVSMKKYTYIYI